LQALCQKKERPGFNFILPRGAAFYDYLKPEKLIKNGRRVDNFEILYKLSD
jgi:hypothetical protein